MVAGESQKRRFLRHRGRIPKGRWASETVEGKRVTVAWIAGQLLIAGAARTVGAISFANRTMEASTSGRGNPPQSTCP